MFLRNAGAAIILSACAWLAAACNKQAVHQAVSMEPLPPSMSSTAGDRYVLAGEWEYVDRDRNGAVDHLTLDEKGNGHYTWKDGRFETRTFIGHTWQGIWSQQENDRDGGFAVEFSPDFSEGEGRWWYSRIGTDHTPTQDGGTFHLRKKTALMNSSDTPRYREEFSRHNR
jgi:hypothetical protein